MPGAQPRRPPPPERPRFTSRAAVLAVVVCAIALSLAYPVREYIAQRRQIDQLQAQSQATTAELGQKAGRPLDGGLDVGKARRLLKTPLRGAEEGLRAMRTALDAGPVTG